MEVVNQFTKVSKVLTIQRIFFYDYGVFTVTLTHCCLTKTTDAPITLMISYIEIATL